MAGSKEDVETVRAFFQDLRARGLGDPLLVLSDGAPGKRIQEKWTIAETTAPASSDERSTRRKQLRRERCDETTTRVADRPWLGLVMTRGSDRFIDLFVRSAMATGTVVKWFNATKGFGFIQPDAGGADVFVHISAVERAGLQNLNEGQKIAYEVVADKRTGKSSADNLKRV